MTACKFKDALNIIFNDKVDGLVERNEANLQKDLNLILRNKMENEILNFTRNMMESEIKGQSNWFMKLFGTK